MAMYRFSILTIGALLGVLLTIGVQAEPVSSVPYFFRSNIMNPDGSTADLLLIGTTVNPLQNTSAIATQGATNLVLQSDTFSDLSTNLPYNPDQLGPWTITATNGSDTATGITHNLFGVQVLPFVSTINLSGSLLTPTLTWVLPATSVPYTRIRVRILDFATREIVFTSVGLSTTATTYTLPSAVLQPDQVYLVRVMLEETQGFTASDLINRSDTRVTYTTSSSTGSAVGVFRVGSWFLDANGNGAWDGCQQDGGQDLCLFGAFGMTGDRPAAGHWDGGAQSSIGVLRSGTGEWFIDYNANHQWDGCVADGCYRFGAPGDWPVAGDWNGTGFAKIGVFRHGAWYLDANGNGAWDGCGTDLCFAFGQSGDLPVAGNWNGGTQAGVGVFRAGTWYLDYNGNGAWDGCQQDGGQDQCLYNSFGMTGDLPAAGDWNGDGKAKVGVFRKGTWYLDYNGNGAWDGCGIDRCYVGSFGQTGDWPVAGKW